MCHGGPGCVTSRHGRAGHRCDREVHPSGLLDAPPKSPVASAARDPGTKPGGRARRGRDRVRRSFGFAVVVLLLASHADAIPRYAARYRQSCNLCHHDPSGGGLRSLYASQFIVPSEMAFRASTEEQLKRIRPDISESVTIGADVRTLHVYADEENLYNFFQMQGEIYAAFQADDRWSAVVNLDETASYEIFALGYVLPWSGYVKVGRFVPLHGWKFDDHNYFVREELGFDQPRNTDAGVEVGFMPANTMLVVSAGNGNAGNTTFDNNKDLAFGVTALRRFHVGPAGIALGVSYRRNRGGTGNANETQFGGPHGYVQWSRFAWLWEVDGTRFGPITPGNDLDGLVTTHEVSWTLRRGVDLVGSYNFVDPNIDEKTGARTRLGIGVDVIATPFVNVQVRANNFQFEPGADVSGRNHWRSEVQLHLFY